MHDIMYNITKNTYHSARISNMEDLNNNKTSFNKTKRIPFFMYLIYCIATDQNLE